MGEVGRHLGGVHDRRIERSVQRITIQCVAHLDQIGERLAVIGWRALELHTIGKKLGSEFAPQYRQTFTLPVIRLRTCKILPRPNEGLRIFEQMVAANVPLEMTFQISDLRGQRSIGQFAKRGWQIRSDGQLLHPDHAAQGNRVRVP